LLQRAGNEGLSRSSEARNFTLNDRQLDAANPRRFPGTEHSRNRGSLELVDGDESALHLAAKQGGELYIRNQVKTAGKVVALQGCFLSLPRDGDALKSLLATGRYRPTGT
jgi:hypothetical protein